MAFTPPLFCLGRGTDARLRRLPTQACVAQDPYRAKLSDEEYRVTRQGGTEKPFTGALLAEKRKGKYYCKCCGSLLFTSEEKYDSKTGWPSFIAAADDAAVKDRLDLSKHMFRFEILCSKCDAHLGHHFPDVTPTGLRYCVNSVALSFEPEAVSFEPEHADSAQ